MKCIKNGCRDNQANLGTEYCLRHIKRSRWERWLNLHNHKMELMRTIFAFMAFILQLIVLRILLT